MRVRYEELVRGMQQERPRDAEWQNQTDRGIGRALCYQARATGNLGKPDEALALAQRAFEAYPNAESAREVAHWCEQLGRMEDAARAMADAFTVPDARNTDADRARDRGQMGDLYRKVKGSENGLGDLVLGGVRPQPGAGSRSRVAHARERSERQSHRSDGVHAERARRRQTADGDPQGEGSGFRFLGDLVRALPHPASAL